MQTKKQSQMAITAEASHTVQYLHTQLIVVKAPPKHVIVCLGGRDNNSGN